MTVFEHINSMKIDELVNWLDKNGAYDFTPWEQWFDKYHCRKCEEVESCGQEYCWCELHNKCRFYPDMAKTPSRKQTIRLWLESEY